MLKDHDKTNAQLIEEVRALRQQVAELEDAAREEQRGVQELLREGEKRYRLLFNMAQDMILIHGFSQEGPPGMFVEVNDIACETLEYSKEEMRHLTPLDIITETDVKDIPEETGVLEAQHTLLFEKTLVSKSGRQIPVEIHTQLFEWNGQLTAFSIARDITDRKQAEEELRQLKEQLQKENVYLREEIQLEHNFSEIIGNCEGLRYILFRIEQLTSTDTTVLILGETGTGKELIARTIHHTGPRKALPLIKVNCAALPSHLIESELFGHEKGAFTGAAAKRIGRFELADGATIFLDEIGELPLNLQAKLLQVLQDREFERVGSSRTLKVDVRVIAATNRDLEVEVQAGRFREDLFYRLNGYAMSLPPLRERREDIPLLVQAFVNKFNKKLGKSIDTIPNKTMDALQSYSWPGNIRELQHIIEKALIIARDTTLRVEFPETTTIPRTLSKTLEDVERGYIQQVLESKFWRIGGPEGRRLPWACIRAPCASVCKLGIKRP